MFDHQNFKMLMRYLSAFLISFLNIGFSLAQPTLMEVSTESNSSLRGLSAVSESICWVSGSEGKVLRTIDAGQNWQDVSPKGYEELQFRDIHALGKETALILSAGLPAIICRTTDGGLHWKEVYRNESEGVFFDAMDFWNKEQGVAFSDAPNNKLLIITTSDGGLSWQQIPENKLPEVHEHQGGFAASGTCIEAFGKSPAIIGLGGPEATVLITNDFGKTWTKTTAPIDFGEPSKGIFSIKMLNEETGVMVGGDYRADSLTTNNLAFTNDGGKSWEAANHHKLTHKYLSAVDYCGENIIIATSRTGIRYSQDGGRNWKALEDGYYSVDCIENSNTCWCSGPNGSVAKIIFK